MRLATSLFVCLSLAVLTVLGCSPDGYDSERLSSAEVPSGDPHSFARPDEAIVKHVALDLTVDFDSHEISGSAALDIETIDGARELVLDTRDLTIHRVTLDPGGAETSFALDDGRPHLGQALRIAIAADTERVTVEYTTSPDAEAVQWLQPSQTAGGEHPFLFTQSQAILARTWVPCQDTPGVRVTYEATVRGPVGLMALMSAENPTTRSADGVYTFTMPQAIPSYLFALAVGDIDFRPLGERSGVYAEPSVVEEAAWEFADVEAMMQVTEELYGPYRWGRYDLLVLPPSFPFGGMENPRLTFATPTILAGDRSLVSLVAHELAHSWSGNLVTNASWDDFWLNEGFTTYLTYRIMEAVYGREYSEMLAVLGRQDVAGTIEQLGADSADTHLELALAGRNPDDGMTDIAYEKGALLLRHIEEEAGRDRWDAFLRSYFDAFAFRSLTTAGFREYLDEHLLQDDPELAARVELDAWINGPGIPPGAPQPASPAFDRVEAELDAWTGGKPAAELETSQWTTHEWLHFLRNLPEPLGAEAMGELDAAWGLTESGNSEIVSAWFGVAIREGYEPAYPALERFLTTVGRRKFLRPLYAALAATPDGLAWAREVYAKARPGYHSVSSNTMDELLGWDGGA